VSKASVYRAILDEGQAGLDSEGWSFPVTLARLAGQLGLGGDLGVRLRKLALAHGDGKLDLASMRDEIDSLRAVKEEEIEASAAAPRLHSLDGPFRVEAARAHLSAVSEPTRRGEPSDIWVAMYGPAHVLAWTELVSAERALFLVPLETTDKTDANGLRNAAATAVAMARQVFPAFYLDVDAVDCSSRVAFAWSWAWELGRSVGGLDRNAKPRRARPVGARRTPRPDLKAFEDKLVAATKEALKLWATDTGADIAQIAFDVAPPRAHIGVCLGSEAGFVTTSRAYDRGMLSRRRGLRYEDWEVAIHAASGEPWLRRFDVSTFSHPRYIEVEFPELEAYTERAAPVEPPGVEPWATGVFRILFTRVIDRIVDDGGLDGISRAPIVWLGYTLRDDVPAVVRVVTKAPPIAITESPISSKPSPSHTLPPATRRSEVPRHPSERQIAVVAAPKSKKPKKKTKRK
jgi:hypothetical protein